MKNNFKLIFLFLLVTFTGFISCQHDDSHLTKNFTAGNSRVINLEELKAIPGAYNQLNTIIQQQHHKGTNDTGWKFDINTEQILHYKSGTNESFTFTVYPETERGYVENLIINTEADGNYSVYYTVYNLTEQDKKNIQAGIFVDVTGKSFICSLTGVDAGSLLKYVGNGDTIIIAGKCYQWQAVRTFTVYNDAGQREYSGWGTELVEVPCPDPGLGGTPTTNPGGTGSGDGGNNDNGYNYNHGGYTPSMPVFNTPTGHEPHEPVPPPKGPNGTIGPRRDIITKPVTFIGSKKECEKIAGIMGTGGYRAKIAAMAGLVNDAVNEHGFGMYQTGVPHDFIPGPEMAVPLPFFGNKYMAFHHTHNAAPDGGTYSIFSNSDINAIMQLMVNNSIDPANFTATLSTKKGTHYAITISNVSKFKAFYFHKFNQLNPANSLEYSAAVKKEIDIIEKYFDIKSGHIKKQNVNNEVTLGHFLNFIKEADLGISVFEADANFETFTQVAKGSSSLSDFTIVRKQCAKQ